MNVLGPRLMRILLCMLALHLITPSNLPSPVATAEETPAWQNGISTWNGAGYESPTVSRQVPKFNLPTARSGPRPYTLPTDPNVADATGIISTPDLPGLPATTAIPTSPILHKPLKLPANSSDRDNHNSQPPSAIPLPNPAAEQSQLALPDESTLSTKAKDSEPAVSIPMTFSSIPDESFNDLPSSARQTLLSAGPTETHSNHLPLPSPATSRANNTTSAKLPTSEAADKVAQADSSPTESNGSEESSESGVSIDTWDSPEAAPLQAEVTRWYQYPRAWIKGWDSHAEFGLDGSDGNANTLAMQAGLELKRTTERYTLGMDINYRQASSRNETTEQNGRFNINFDRLLGDTSWSAFAKHGLEWDKFKPFDLRINLNGGFGYYWLRNDISTFATRFGAGASREIGAPMDDWIPEAVFGMEAERQLTSRQKLKGKCDYFPAWEDFGDYRLVSDVSWEILLDGSENLSLKLAATDRYDSTPQGAKPNDVYYSLLLLYKF